MSDDLPNGWIEATLGDITLDCSQRIPDAAEHFSYIDISSIDRAKKKIASPQLLVGETAPSRARKVVQSGDTLVSMTRPNLNAVAIVSEEHDGQIASTGFDVLRPHSVEPRWVYYLTRSNSFVAAMSELVQGALYPAVRSSDVRSFSCPVAPLNEQKRIADKLDSLLARVDACRERLDRIPTILKRLRQSILAAACSGRLTADWRKEHSEAAAFRLDDSKSTPNEQYDAYDVPSTWEKTQLGTLISLVTSGSRGWAQYYADSGEIFIRAQNINSDVLNLEDIAFVRLPDRAEGLRTRVEFGDILLTITGANVTKAAMVDVDLGNAYVSQHVALIRLSDPHFSPFLYLWIVSTVHGRGQLLEQAYGLGKPGLNLQNIRDLNVAIPPIAEQQEIVRRVKRLSALANEVESRLTAARSQVECLTPSSLSKAFRGELVPQDPADEPADDLLKRIRQAKATEVSKPRLKESRILISEQKVILAMLKRSEIQANHLTEILRSHGSLTAEALWAASQLEIDDFYDQLKAEEEAGLLKERKKKGKDEVRILEVA